MIFTYVFCIIMIAEKISKSDGRALLTNGDYEEEVRISKSSFKSWIMTGIDLNSINYDSSSPNTFEYFKDTPLNCKTTMTFPLNILMIGDSVNEYLIKDNCERYWNGTYLSTWSDKFTYKNGSGTTGCQSSWGFIGHAHVYGSALRGPYLHKLYEKKDDEYMDTIVRIPLVVHEFKNAIGEPSFIFYRTELWDLHEHGGWNGHPVLADTPLKKSLLMKKYISDYSVILNHIRHASPKSYIGLHTVPTITWGAALFYHYIFSMQYIASSTADVFLMDWNKLIHLYERDGGKVLRDGHHPSLELSLYFGTLMVDAFSAWLKNCQLITL